MPPAERNRLLARTKCSSKHSPSGCASPCGRTAASRGAAVQSLSCWGPAITKLPDDPHRNCGSIPSLHTHPAEQFREREPHGDDLVGLSSCTMSGTPLALPPLVQLSRRCFPPKLRGDIQESLALQSVRSRADIAAMALTRTTARPGGGTTAGVNRHGPGGEWLNPLEHPGPVRRPPQTS